MRHNVFPDYQRKLRPNPPKVFQGIGQAADVGVDDHDIAVVLTAGINLFTWYWIADLCAEHKIPFILRHALYMKAIHGGKAKNDKIDSRKIAALMRGGTFPMAYVYPAEMRATRDLLRRRNHLTRKRAELLSHIQNSNSQYNLDPFEVSIKFKKTRSRLELHITKNAKVHNPQALYRLKNIPGIGAILSLVILYEIGPESVKNPTNSKL